MFDKTVNVKKRIFFLFFIFLFFLFSCSTKPRFGKLGIVVPIGNGIVSSKTPYLISGVYEDSPAYTSGVRPDDVILEINEVPLTGLRYNYIHNSLLRGKIGTTVMLKIKRDEKKVFIFKIIRE